METKSNRELFEVIASRVRRWIFFPCEHLSWGELSCHVTCLARTLFLITSTDAMGWRGKHFPVFLSVIRNFLPRLIMSCKRSSIVDSPQLLVSPFISQVIRRPQVSLVKAIDYRYRARTHTPPATICNAFLLLIRLKSPRKLYDFPVCLQGKPKILMKIAQCEEFLSRSRFKQ
jgi:hypothetical protein